MLAQLPALQFVPLAAHVHMHMLRLVLMATDNVTSCYIFTTIQRYVAHVIVVTIQRYVVHVIVITMGMCNV